MPVSSVNSSSSTLDTQSAGVAAAGGADRFLKLLVAQMQNQDPLNPMDNAQVTSQMAQINTVTGIEKLNTTVQGLSSQFAQLQALQGASLVGRDVIVPGNLMDIDPETAVGQGGFELTSAADSVTVEVLSASGQVVETLNLGAQSAGMHSFNWNAGTATNDSGLRFRVTSRLGSVNTTATALMRDTVDAISTSGTGFNLQLARTGTVAYSDVKAFN
jgi:flagellar basal-body rod modification protein FlgD